MQVRFEVTTNVRASLSLSSIEGWLESRKANTNAMPPSPKARPEVDSTSPGLGEQTDEERRINEEK